MKNKGKRNPVVYVVGNLSLIGKYFWDSMSIQCIPCAAGEFCPPCHTSFMANFSIYLLVWNICSVAFMLSQKRFARKVQILKLSRSASLISVLLLLTFAIQFGYSAFEYFILDKYFEGFMVILPVIIFCLLQIIPFSLFLIQMDWLMLIILASMISLVVYLSFQRFAISLLLLPSLLVFYSLIFWREYSRKAIGKLPLNG